MAWAAIGGAAISAVPGIFKGITGIGQSNRANKINAVNPGYEINQNVVDNARILSDQYGNYSLPGYSQIKSGIDNNFNEAFANGVQGATSGGDVLDLATKMAYGKNNAYNQLGIENAQGKQSMLGQYLNARAAAGNEYQNKNAYDRDQYDRTLREKAALTQAGATNTFGAIDQIAGAAGKALLSSDEAGGSGRSRQLPGAVSPTADQVNYIGAIDTSWNKYYNADGTPRRLPVNATLSY